jgi:hypothetical protein
MGLSRCVAPIKGRVSGDRICGARATTTRLVERVWCPLCAEHAAVIDRERRAQAPKE